MAGRTGEKSAGEITVVEAADREVRRTVAVALGVALLLGIGVATYFGVKHTLRDVRAVGLQAMRDAQIGNLRTWMEQRVTSAERWASQPGVRQAVTRMRAAPSCGSADTKALAGLLAPAMHERGFVTWEVVERGGTIIASLFPEYCGRRVDTAGFLARIERSFAGESLFLRPMLEGARVREAPPRFAGPLVWVAVPVRSADGIVIATLVLGEPAGTRFATVMTVPGIGRTDEAYALDDQGLMLTESRHARLVAEAGLLKDASRPATTLNAEVRDPGGDVLAGHRPEEELAARPRTRLAALATAARQKSAAEEKHGVLLDPYRNYRGVEVIGAWRWLDTYDMGVALEIESDEGYAPLRNLDRAFAVVLALAILTGLLILYSTVGAVRERLRFGRVRRIGRYTLQEQIGEGGMSQVYTGRHALLKRPIAIKILKRQASDELIERFEREAQLASRLSHPNTVEVYDYGHTGAGEIYYVMEYVDGVTLAELVDREGALPAARVVYLLRQVCSAIGHAHEQGVLHRDIKPENIMACVRGGEHDVVKVLDFGLVKNLHEKATRDLTQSVLRVLGTPVYMSPERFSDPASADVRSDVYSIGAVAYLLASGRRLYDGSQGDDLQFRILHSTPVAPSELRAGPLPAALEALVLKCLEKRPEDRPQSVRELLDRLRELALEHPWSERDAAASWSRYAAREPLEA